MAFRLLYHSDRNHINKLVAHVHLDSRLFTQFENSNRYEYSIAVLFVLLPLINIQTLSNVVSFHRFVNLCLSSKKRNKKEGRKKKKKRIEDGNAWRNKEEEEERKIAIFLLHCATREERLGDERKSGGAREPLNVLPTFGNGSSSVSMALLASPPRSFSTDSSTGRNKGRETRFFPPLPRRGGEKNVIRVEHENLIVPR